MGRLSLRINKKKELSLMKKVTSKRKATAKEISNIIGEDQFSRKVLETISWGKKSFDSINYEMGRMLAESILLMDRERLSGPDYRPMDSEIKKWSHQGGSVFIGDQKVKVSVPRLRGPDGEINLPSYEKLKSRGQFSEEILIKAMAGLAGRRYHETVTETAQAFGVSPSSISRHFVEVSGTKLKEFLERDLSKIDPFAILLDTVYRGGVAFIVALGIDLSGEKWALGFWEGATENNEICKELLADLERRGLKVDCNIIFVTDGGKGIIKCLREKFGAKLLHQRCTIHKDHNLQKHLAKKYRKLVSRKFRTALNHKKYNDVKKALVQLEDDLRQINESAANSLSEALPELLTLHKLEIPDELKKSLHTTNGIENLFSTVRQREKNVKNFNPKYKGKEKKSKMSRRWFAAVLLTAEKNFKKVNGFEQIKATRQRIEILQNDNVDMKRMSA